MKLRVEGRNFRLTDTAGRIVPKALTFRPPDLKEFRMSRLFRFIVFSPTRLFCRGQAVLPSRLDLNHFSLIVTNWSASIPASSSVLPLGHRIRIRLTREAFPRPK